MTRHAKETLYSAIQEAIAAGARAKIACREVGISLQTYLRWGQGLLDDARKGAGKIIPRKLSTEEEETFYKVATEARFRELPPEQITATLLDEGTYYGSARTLYRIFKKRQANIARTESRRAGKSRKPQELVATGPNQVWCWDITWLKTPVKGLFLYAYVIVDIYSRAIVGGSVEDEEDDQLAKELFRRVVRDRDVMPDFIHSDNGGPMKGLTLVSFLVQIGVAMSFSRPRVSDDNPFIESLFRTLKYHVTYPKFFRDLNHAREWFAGFVDWYNNVHRHSGIDYVTPHQRHNGQHYVILEARQKTLDAAAAAHPERFVNGPKQYNLEGVVVLNPAA